MKKIDDDQHQRLNKALIRLKRELNLRQQQELASEMDKNRRALQLAYKNYTRSIERLSRDVEHYLEAFDNAHANYREGCRKRKHN